MKGIFLITWAILLFTSAIQAQRSDITFVRSQSPPLVFSDEIRQLEDLISGFCFPLEKSFDKRMSKSFNHGWRKISTREDQTAFMVRYHVNNVFEINTTTVRESKGSESVVIEIIFWRIEKGGVAKKLVAHIPLVNGISESENDFAQWLTSLRKDLQAAIDGSLAELLDVQVFRVADNINDKLVANDYVEQIPKNLVSQLIIMKLDVLRPSFCHEHKNPWHIRGDIKTFKNGELKLRVVLKGKQGTILDGPFMCKLSDYPNSVKSIARILKNQILADLNKTQP